MYQDSFYYGEYHLTQTNLDDILDKVMNLGMELRQNQLNGHDTRSDNEILSVFKNNNGLNN